jgi:hypothetical protein
MSTSSSILITVLVNVNIFIFILNQLRVHPTDLYIYKTNVVLIHHMKTRLPYTHTHKAKHVL